MFIPLSNLLYAHNYSGGRPPSPQPKLNQPDALVAGGHACTSADLSLRSISSRCGSAPKLLHNDNGTPSGLTRQITHVNPGHLTTVYKP